MGRYACTKHTRRVMKVLLYPGLLVLRAPLIRADRPEIADLSWFRLGMQPLWGLRVGIPPKKLKRLLNLICPVGVQDPRRKGLGQCGGCRMGPPAQPQHCHFSLPCPGGVQRQGAPRCAPTAGGCWRGVQGPLPNPALSRGACGWLRTPWLYPFVGMGRACGHLQHPPCLALGRARHLLAQGALTAAPL